MNIDEIVKLAKEVRKNAHTEISKYKVGAVLITKNGKVYTGCNVENQGIMSICAERVAFVKAISESETNFESILIVGATEGSDVFDEITPCGYCRQFISEFVSKDFNIYISYGENESVKKYTIEELLPESFKL